MQTIYCLSGLGADQRIFQKLKIPGCKLEPVHWAEFDKYDDLPCYAQKMSIRIPEDDPIIIGVSFGGMLTAEIAKLRTVKKAILISSAKDASEFPPVSSFARFMVHNGLIPVGIAKRPGKQIFSRFGAATDEEKELLTSILKGTDNKFAKWSMRAIVDWQSNSHVPGILHLHGTADKMIPPEHVKPDYWIDGGTHFMVYQRAAEISSIIQKQLAPLL